MKKILDRSAYLNALNALSAAIRCGAERQLFVEAPFTYQGMVSYVINSRILGQPMLVEVALPSGYSMSNNEIKYPVMYMMDCTHHMELFDNTNILNSSMSGIAKNNVKEIITVGIDFIGTKADIEGFRLDYFTPLESEDDVLGSVGGKADCLAQFIELEVKPLVNERFYTDVQNESLAGHLQGGFFTLYTLFSHAELFGSYIASSPILTLGNNSIGQHEGDYFSLGRGLSKNVYISIGSMEAFYRGLSEAALDFVKFLKLRNYNGLRLMSEIHQDENHNSAIVRSYASGARFIYNEAFQDGSQDLASV